MNKFRSSVFQARKLLAEEGYSMGYYSVSPTERVEVCFDEVSGNTKATVWRLSDTELVGVGYKGPVRGMAA